jgi:hypothetical protein
MAVVLRFLWVGICFTVTVAESYILFIYFNRQ